MYGFTMVFLGLFGYVAKPAWANEALSLEDRVALFVKANGTVNAAWLAYEFQLSDEEAFDVLDALKSDGRIQPAGEIGDVKVADGLAMLVVTGPKYDLYAAASA